MRFTITPGGIRYLFDVCDELEQIDPCSGGDEVNPLEDDEIPMKDCLKIIRREADKIEAIG